MGLLDKVKSMFVEEIPEDTNKTIKKEVIKVPIPAPEEEIEREEKAIETKSEKKEEKFVFPVYMDEDDEIDPKEELIKSLYEKKEEQKETKKDSFRDFGSEYETPSRESEYRRREEDLKAAFSKPAAPVKRDSVSPIMKKPTYEEELAARRKLYSGNVGEKKEIVVPSKKTFQPTPIISPVYGILDQNYTKDDIKPKGNKQPKPKGSTLESEELTIDDVRMKAFGTLEDEIDSSLFEDDVHFAEDGLRVDLDDNLLNDELENYLEEEVKIEKPKRTRRAKAEIIEEPEDNMIEEMLSRSYDDEEIEEVASEEDENLYMSENDLFNLIDSMYEKRDEE